MGRRRNAVAGGPCGFRTAARGEGREIESGQTRQRCRELRPEFASAGQRFNDAHTVHPAFAVVAEGEIPGFAEHLGERFAESGQGAGRSPRLVLDEVGQCGLHRRGVAARRVEGLRERRAGDAVAQQGKQEQFDRDRLAPLSRRNVGGRLRHMTNVVVEMLVKLAKIHECRTPYADVRFCSRPTILTETRQGCNPHGRVRARLTRTGKSWLSGAPRGRLWKSRCQRAAARPR